MALCLSVCLSVSVWQYVCLLLVVFCRNKWMDWACVWHGGVIRPILQEIRVPPRIMVLPCGTLFQTHIRHFAMARVVNLAWQRLTLSMKNWTVFGHCKLTILATASLSQRVCAWGSASRGSICDSWYLLDRPPVYMMSDRHAALLLATVHLPQLVSATASRSCSEYRTTQLGSFSKHQDDTTLARCWGRYTGCPFNRGSSRK